MARRALAPWDAAIESTVAEFVAQSIAEGASRSATHAAIRDMGLSMPAGRMSAMWSVGERAVADVMRQLPPADIVPALDGLTAPAAMKIATDYVHNVRLTGAGGRERFLMVATNNPSLTENDILGEAQGTANDRSRYEPGTAIPPGGWIAQSIEQSWHRGG